MTPVLVADDSDSIRRLVRAMLAGEEYEVREAADGVEALDALRASEQPMVVLLDYRMPRIDGFGVLHAAVENGQMLTQNEYIIITSEAGTFPESFIDLLRRLSIRVLPKPFDQEALVSAVALAVERLNAPVEQALSDIPKAGQQDAM